MIPETLSHYRIVWKLGAGAMGEVYLARDTQLDRLVALKILPPEVSGDEKRLGRFIREAKAASSLSHANVAHIHEIGESQGIHFIAMEYVEGRTLASELEGKLLATNRILDVAIQAADALDEAHAKDIVHRDINPANLMVTERGQVKVLDFGLAKLTRPSRDSEGTTLARTEEGVVVGTIQYMSPDQALGRDANTRSDIFSLGVLLYELATVSLIIINRDKPVTTRHRKTRKQRRDRHTREGSLGLGRTSVGRASSRSSRTGVAGTAHLTHTRTVAQAATRHS